MARRRRRNPDRFDNRTEYLCEMPGISEQYGGKGDRCVVQGPTLNSWERGYGLPDGLKVLGVATEAESAAAWDTPGRYYGH